VSASVGAANMYYWRGLDLGGGDAAVWGDLKVSGGGFYGGVWASSGDDVGYMVTEDLEVVAESGGQEYDLYVGYGGSAGDFRYDLSVWSYAYPTVEIAPGDVGEVVGSIGYGPVTFTYYEGIWDLEDYNYMTLAATFGDFTVKYGVHEDDLAHVDLSYAFNSKVSFTLGKVIDDVDGFYNDEVKFVAALSLPIE
jgi:uncharacterized protein (TIGR02001 family)